MWQYELLKRFGRDLIIFRFDSEARGQVSPPDDQSQSDLLVLLEQAGITKYIEPKS